MATLYLRCGTGVSSFVIHSKSSGTYPKTVTATSWTAYTGFAATKSDAYISDVVYKSGYSSATIYSSTTDSEWSVSSDPYISLATYSTRYAEVRATSSPPTVYRVSCSSGTGISKFTYLNSTTSGTGSTVTSVGANVGSGGYLYLKDFTFESGYGYPVTVTCSNPSGTWSIPNASSGDHKISPPSNGGTRSATLTATQKKSYTLTCYFGSEINSATFDNGTTVTRRDGYGTMTYYDNVKITDVSLSEKHSDWNGRIYWRSHNGTTEYYVAQIVNGNVVMRGSSYQEPITCTGDRSIDIYAVITVTKKYRVHAFGNGGVTSGGASESWWPSDQSYSNSDDASFDFPLSRLQTFTKQNASFLGWAYGAVPSEGETAYTTTIRLSATEDGTTNNLHAVWKDLTHIDLFTWFQNESIDAASIKQGLNRNMSEYNWSKFRNKIFELAAAEDVTVTVPEVTSGSQMLASQFNGAVDALAIIRTKLRSSTPLPGKLTPGVSGVLASQFQGNGSLKGCLNALIAKHNGD